MIFVGWIAMQEPYKVLGFPLRTMGSQNFNQGRESDLCFRKVILAVWW
jgi:hypothetical protein